MKLLIPLVLLALVMTACRDNSGSSSEQLQYVVTTAPVKLILDPVIQGRASSRVLLPPGADAHTYEPRPSDLRAAIDAAALVWVHPHLDGWAAKLPAREHLQLMPLLPWSSVRLMPAESSQHVHNKGEQSNLDADPHFWTDPQAVMALLPLLVKQLARLDPEGEPIYRANAARFKAELKALDAETRRELAPLAGQSVVQFHPSFNYMFARYGIRSAGAVEHFPGKEPSPKYLASVVERVKKEHVGCVCTETLAPSRPAESLANAAGVPMMRLDPACGNPDAQYADYADWLRWNVDQLVATLGPSK